MSDDEIKQIEQAGREAFHRGDNKNPYIEAPSQSMTRFEYDEWTDKFIAWGDGYIEESRKQK